MEQTDVRPVEALKSVSKKVEIVGVAVCEGQGHHGAEMAPNELREAGLIEIAKSLGWKVNDLGNITNDDVNISKDSSTKNEEEQRQQTVKNSKIIGGACKKLRDITFKSASEGSFTIILGGDHGIATGSITGVKEAHPNLKVIWIDAHGDCNTPEVSPSGNYHGMPVAHLLGWFGEGSLAGFEWFKPTLKPEDIVFIGLRDIDDFEKSALKKHNIKVFDMDDVTEIGIGEVMNQALAYLNPDGAKNPLHISFDIDGVDPRFAPQTGTPARGGLTYREAHYIVRKAAKTGQLVSMDLVEINTQLYSDVLPKRLQLHGDSKLIKTDSETVALGVELLASALGHRLCL